jgi:hypothetical protein
VFDDCLSKKASVDVHEYYTYVVMNFIDLKGKEKCPYRPHVYGPICIFEMIQPGHLTKKHSFWQWKLTNL